MSVTVLIISHHTIGAAMVETITTTFGGQLPLKVHCYSIQCNTDPDTALAKLSGIISNIDQGDGVLILTDLYGSTPCNLATKLQSIANKNVVTGMNLSMLVRVMNYPDQTLSELAQTAYRGGQEGILICDQANPSISANQ